ncbi:MAG: TIR domain-containing protein, partial [Chloroflexota bacterium]
MADVFISYSRKNGDFARKLIDRLTLANKDSWVDWEGIPLSSPNWWNEIKAGIENADNFIFIMSPESMASVVCNMELDYAFDLKKRIIPVVYQEITSREAFASIADFEPDDAMRQRLDGQDALVIARDNWQKISHINWLFFRDDDNFDDAFTALIDTVETDIQYVKAHTRYLTRANEWQRAGQPVDLLLFGDEIDRAEAWLQKAEDYATALSDEKVEVVNPLAQDLHYEYITASRQADQIRKRQTRIIQGLIGVLVVVAIIAASLSVNAINDSNIANTQVAEANIANTESNQIALDANAEVTAVQPTLTSVAQQIAEGEQQLAIIEAQRLSALGETLRASVDGYDETATLLGIRAMQNANIQQVQTLLNAQLQTENYTLQQLSDHEDMVWGALELSDGRFLSWSDDSSLRLWSSEGDELAVLVGHEASVLGAMELFDGRLLSWSWDSTLRLWTSSGTELVVLRGHERWVNGAMELSD